MWLKYLPWRFVISRAAKGRGFLDPLNLLSQLHRFSQPSEVREPVELLRAGVIMHARGLLNTQAIQHNLDWVWPYWVERQFNPRDPSFIPRAFSITHVNLTHRNWSAVGLPDCGTYSLIDPRGLVTPHYDGWSIDLWVLRPDGSLLIPARASEFEQRYSIDERLSVVSRAADAESEIASRVWMEGTDSELMCVIEANALSRAGGALLVTFRPYNPEGVSFIHDFARGAGSKSVLINTMQRVRFADEPAEIRTSTYRGGDIATQLSGEPPPFVRHCEVGMLTAAAVYPLDAKGAASLRIEVPLEQPGGGKTWMSWDAALAGTSALQLQDSRINRLFREALATLLLLTPDEVYPGPYTYRRFWFRDAAFMLHSLLCCGLHEQARRVIDKFRERQTRQGYFLSQEGEWDSNGAALWIMQRYVELTGDALPDAWYESVLLGAEWIINKRLPDDLAAPYAGLLPAGFSAEHLGSNDYYYWDDFWGVAGLRAAEFICAGRGELQRAARYRREADKFWSALEKSWTVAVQRNKYGALPASPNRRMDSGAIGSLCAAYPLQLVPVRDTAILATVDFLLAKCCVKNGFFQDMIHSGINPYLTLHMAQVLLRAGDQRWLPLVESVAALATPTGQWPEAVHPQTGGGCMGDGQHGWAAAEWIMMLRNCFVMEEGEVLTLCAGIPQNWIAGDAALSFGPTYTKFGRISVEVRGSGDRADVQWRAAWRREPKALLIALPGCPVREIDPKETSTSFGNYEASRVCAS